MSAKRPRAAYEADLRAQQSPYVSYGTPLPPLDPEVRDDGSYVPVWKQEVRDERGRKRLHGAFTGGWSAGYFNTVGSKEGWAPSTFVSSRSDRHKDGGGTKTAQQRPEDFMDEEDLADAAEAQTLQTAQGFGGLGSTNDGGLRRGVLDDLFRSQGETAGVKLLKKMGWKEGQGIGPKVRRNARLDLGNSGASQSSIETHLFAPENVPMIAFIRKLDRKGLGYDGETSLDPLNSSRKDSADSSGEENGDRPLQRPRFSVSSAAKSTSKPSKGGIGIGILNDTGSDDEDPYEMGPKISYNRVIGGDKKKKKKTPNATAVNPALRSAPTFVSRKKALENTSKTLRKCHDGRLPLDGFVFSAEMDSLTSMITEIKFPPPEIPQGWKSSKQAKADSNSSSGYLSTADAAKASTLDPKSRAALLGEAQLPGKSVFDFLSPAARDRLATASGKPNLPPALGEIPEGYAMTEAEREQELLSRVPQLDKETAIAAISRGASGAAPYADNEAKRTRYRSWLEYSAGFAKTAPSKPAGMAGDDWVRELGEFTSCARIFKPMSGRMASRFTPSTSSKNKFISGSSGDAKDEELVSKPIPKPADPAEEAAKMGMYGSMTRSVTDFYPTRLLCKRFNVRPPAHVQPDADQGPTTTAAAAGKSSNGADLDVPQSMGGAMTLDEMIRQAQLPERSDDTQPKAIESAPPPKKVEIRADINEALEGKRAQDDVLKAIFGDSSDEEE